MDSTFKKYITKKLKLSWASQLAIPSTIHWIFSLDSVGKSNFWIPSLILTFLSSTIGYFKPILQKEIFQNIMKCSPILITILQKALG